MFSGIGLEGLKITSHSEFIRMVEDYAGLDDEEEIQALEAVWVENYGLVSPNIQGPFDDDLLSAGREVHEGNCLDCHASAKWAFTGFTMAKLIKPVAVPTGPGRRHCLPLVHSHYRLFRRACLPPVQQDVSHLCRTAEPNSRSGDGSKKIFAGKHFNPPDGGIGRLHPLRQLQSALFSRHDIRSARQ
jgi:hypothetical protein